MFSSRKNLKIKLLSFILSSGYIATQDCFTVKLEDLETITKQTRRFYAVYSRVSSIVCWIVRTDRTVDYTNLTYLMHVSQSRSFWYSHFWELKCPLKYILMTVYPRYRCSSYIQQLTVILLNSNNFSQFASYLPVNILLALWTVMSGFDCFIISWSHWFLDDFFLFVLLIITNICFQVLVIVFRSFENWTICWVFVKF